MYKVRGKDITMIFQEPMTSLNPVFTIGFQLDEVSFTHNPSISKQDAKAVSIEMLKKSVSQCRKECIRLIRMNCPAVCVKEL